MSSVCIDCLIEIEIPRESIDVIIFLFETVKAWS